MIQFTPVGDSGMLAVCGSEISEQVNAQVMALDAAVQAAQLPGVVETVPTYAALLVTLDPLQTDADTLIPALRRLWDALPPLSSTVAGRLVEVPVCYGGDYGPDLAFVAQHAGLTEQQVIDIHCGRDYRIFMLGFLPGFPYLGAACILHGGQRAGAYHMQVHSAAPCSFWMVSNFSGLMGTNRMRSPAA